jgi:hypothetical protein
MNHKKPGLLLTFLLLASLVLAACAGGNANDNNGLGNENSGVIETEIPVTGPEDGVEEPDMVETPLATEVPTDVVDEVVETPVAEATATAAADDDAVVDAPACQPNRLSRLLDYGLVTSDGVRVGEVEALVVLRPGNIAYGVDEGLFVDNSTGDAVEATAEAPALVLPASAPAPVIGYVVADIDDASLEDLNLEDGDLLLPFSAFQPLAAGAADAVVDDCVMTLNLVGTDLATAPFFDDDAWDFTIDGWDADVVAFTEGLGLAVPALANGAPSRPVVFEDGIFDQVDIDVENLDDEDLGEIEEFIVNPQDGAFKYAVLVTNSFLGLGGKSIPVPMTHLLWVDEDEDLEDLGEIIIPVEEGAFENAPEFDLDTVDFTVDTWDDAFEAFWAENVTR